MAGTIIDSLVVMLGLDSKDLETKAGPATKAIEKIEKQGDKTEKSVKRISTASKETSKTITDLSRVVASFLTVIGGTYAIKAFIQDFIDTNAQLDRLSKNLSISVSTISAWSNASEQLGGSAAGLQGTFDMLSKSQTQLMLTGESSLIPYMSALGVALADVNGKARPVTDILLDLADRFSKMDRTQANNIGRMMGIDQGTLNLLLQGRKELEIQIRRQKEQNAVTAAQAAEATKLQTAIVGVKQTFMALGRTLLMDAAPSIEKLIGYFQTFADWISQNKQTVETFLGVLAVGLGAIALATLPLDLTALAVLGLAAAIALLYNDYQTWKSGGDSLIDWGKWKPAIDAATTALQILGNEIKADFWLLEKLVNLWDKLPNWVKSSLAVGVNIPGGALGVPGLAGGNNDSRFQNLPNVSKDDSLANAIARREGAGVKGSRAQRNNNPGDMEYGPFAIRHGAIGSDGRFAIFPDAATGKAALSALLASPGYANLTTEQKIQKYAPSSENDTSAYIASVRQFLASRGGGYASSLAGVPGASRFAAAAPGSPQGGGNADRSVTTHIDTINVHTQATDAEGIASDIGQSLDYLFASQANYGLN